MALSKKEFSSYIKQFKFRELFNDMGWNDDTTAESIVVDTETFKLQAVAEKSRFRILVCNPQANGLLPDYSTRRKIETKVTKLFQEHLIIFFDKNETEQIWQLVVRQLGKPAKITETRWHIEQSPELLYQRAGGIYFEMDEEDKITIVDVTKRIGENFHQNNEKVTKQFYDKFKKEHTSFISFIKGIDEKTNQEWYASLMLNRLMFCYFIQKKGFLDNNKTYLRDKLNACKEKKDKIKFYSFYRNFLLVLFHKGLNEPKQNQEVTIEIGKIPYLNGGLFDEHDLEKIHTNIDIDDKAFERLFDFFDQYEWHLDTRTTATGKDINPDVIGYIFEKYINDRANMGAYYTKEDITDYISKNCILPYLFDETKRNYSKAFTANSDMWQMVKENGDQYIYDAVKKGTELTLPDEIEHGIKHISKRKEWNKTATIDYALPTEIWREVVDRRNRYTEVKSKLDNGEVIAINDFITYNLNIRQFAQDTIENTNDPEFLKHFYKALTSVTIIDPTCGSGAFLFAAMNILEPLYEACIQRMRMFIEDEDRLNKSDAKSFNHKFKFFRTILEDTQNEQHTNLQYFIYKSIILRNLYGVDIMNEAVEIAKLRLFLKLVATVEVDSKKDNFGLEPLPDIDFNIRAGNTLVGFATEEELTNAFIGTVDFDNSKEKLEEKCEIVATAFKRYKEIQLTYGDGFQDFKEAKEELNIRLKELNHELNILQAPVKKYEDWLSSHKPFHWFAEFYEIIKGKGGFDVVIGNPPYVELKKVDYDLKNYATENCGNLYATVIERYFKFININSKSGMIIPHSSICTNRMANLINIFNKIGIWFSSYDIRPAKLFEGVDQRLLIYITDSNSQKSNTSTFHRWSSELRPFLFSNLEYVADTENPMTNSIVKASKIIERSIIEKIWIDKKISNSILKNSSDRVLYHNSPRYFIRFMSTPPYFKSEKSGEKKSGHLKSLCFNSNYKVFAAVLNSSLFYWFFIKFSNCRDLVERDIFNFPFSIKMQNQEQNALFIHLFEKLNQDFEKNKYRKRAFYKASGQVEYDEYYPKKSKSIINEIDTVLAEHYGFTDEELDFIINYDIKYRMGKELEKED